MEIREKTIVIEQKSVVYVAEDGTEFDKEYKCIDYEKKQALKELIEEAEKLRIEELDEVLPINNDGSICECNTFRWYRLENEDDFFIVNKAYGNQLREPETYPEIMCVETIGYEAYMDDSYNYNMEIGRKITKEFWEKLGYRVTFEKMYDYFNRS